jgi:hypothetical protein
MEIYMDDFTTYGDEFDVALANLENTLIRCKDSNVSLSNEKCFMMGIDGTVPEHRISEKGIQVDPEKINITLNFPTPTSQKQVQIFIGYVGYYRRFIENFSHISRPLFSLLSKDIELLWIETCQNVLDELKVKVSEAPVLRGLDWTLPFHISTDASDTTIEGKGPYAIYYVS